MQKREDSCDLYFWEVADVGECNYADYLVAEESQYQQVGVLDK